MSLQVRWAVCGLAVVAAVLLVEDRAQAGAKVYVNRPCNAADRPSPAQIDHRPYDALLRKYVDGRGRVAYARWKANTADMQALGAYLAHLGCVDTAKQAPRAAQLAYWINAYNALTLHGILREYPTSSIRKHTGRLGAYNIWKDLLLWVNGNYFSLNDIEHKVLRKMGEPRIHFALVCASIGCPQLASGAYTGANLEAMLSTNARRFFAQPSNFRADPSTRTVYLSELLKWYGTDFAPSPAAQVRTLRRYLPSPESMAWVDSANFSVKYLPYDWSLNDQK